MRAHARCAASVPRRLRWRRKLRCACLALAALVAAPLDSSNTQEFAAGHPAYAAAVAAEAAARGAKNAAAAAFRAAYFAHERSKRARRPLDRLRCLPCLLMQEADATPADADRRHYCSKCKKQFCGACWAAFAAAHTRWRKRCPGVCARCGPCCAERADLDPEDFWTELEI